MKDPASKMPPEPNTSGPMNPFRGKVVWLLIFAVFGGLIAFNLFQNPPGAKAVTYSEIKAFVQQDKVDRVVIHHDARIDAWPTDAALEKARTKGATSLTYWRATRLPGEDTTLIPLLDEKKVKYDVREGCDEGGMIWMWLMPLLLIMFFWNVIMRRMNAPNGPSGNNPAMDFAKSRAKMYVEEETSVTFGDVAGCEEAKSELTEVVDFLKDPEHISRLGGQLPKGVLLVGPPGTGKTLLARAVAGEAGVAFFNLSGSDFVEMFVGVGAARVRDLFKQAKEHAPCIVFVDELDAIGKSRSANQMQSNDEREQTLNALLVEMDGFDTRSGVILLAATNRPEILDRALLRPGRFDRQVLVDKPDVRGREQILRVHAKKIIMSETVDLQKIAAQTPGFVGADLANVINEAALLAARLDKDAVDMADLEEAGERVVGGLEMKSRRLGDKEKNIVSYHESGHAIVAAAMQSTLHSVHKISIVSRGMAALGYMKMIPQEERHLQTKTEFEQFICIALGGRAAEQLVFGDVTNGASDDLRRVAGIARGMVTEYGMSARIGQVYHGERGGSQFLDTSFSQRNYSEETAVAIDQEVRAIVDERYQMTLAILEKNMDLLIEMAEQLKEVEVLENEPLAALLDKVQPLDPDVMANFSRDGSIL